jgi:hypothetical protein
VRVDDEAVRALDPGEPVAGAGCGQGGPAVRAVHVHPDVELITRIADIGQVVDDPGVRGPGGGPAGTRRPAEQVNEPAQCLVLGVDGPCPGLPDAAEDVGGARREVEGHR